MLTMYRFMNRQNAGEELEPIVRFHVGALTKVHEQYADRCKESFLAALDETDFGSASWGKDARCSSPAQEILESAFNDYADEFRRECERLEGRS